MAAMLVLCVLVPGALGGWQVSGHPGAVGSVPLQIVITTWAGLRLARLWARGEPRPFATIFWLFVYVWLGLAGLLQVIHQSAPWPFPISSSALVRGQIIILLGLAAMEIGHLFPQRTGTRRRSGRHIVGSRVTALVAFTLVIAPLWYFKLGGLHALLRSREELRSAIYGGNGLHVTSGSITLALATVPTFLALYATIVTRRYKVWGKGSRLVMVLLILVVLVLNSPIAMPRFWVVTMLVALVFAIPAVQKRAAGTRIVVAAVIFGSVVVFPYAAYFRYTSGFKHQPPGITQSLTTRPDYDSFEMISAGVQYTFDAGYRHGSQLFADLFFFVPRAIWPAKAQDTGVVIGSYNGFALTNLSAPLWIEMYIDFGYIGVAIMFFLYGLMMRRADDRFVKGNSPFAQFVIPLLAGYSCIILRGSLLQSMARLAVMLAIMWLISVRDESKRRPQVPELQGT